MALPLAWLRGVAASRISGFHHRLMLGTARALQVFWINLEELSRQSNLDPLLNLLSLSGQPP